MRSTMRQPLRRSLDRHRGAPRIGDVADDGEAKARRSALIEASTASQCFLCPLGRDARTVVDDGESDDAFLRPGARL